MARIKEIGHYKVELESGVQEAVHSLGNYDVAIIDEIKAGRSGAYIFLVNIEPVAAQLGAPKGPHVLKVDRRERGEEERRRHERARGTHISSYMAEIVDSGSSAGGWTAILYTLANYTHDNSRMLSILVETSFARAKDQVRRLAAILYQWNKGCSVAYSLHRELLSFLLKSRVAQITEKAKTSGTGPETVLIHFEGDEVVLPNPFAYLSRSKLWQQQDSTLIWPKGHSHGDLHGNNIVCPLPEARREQPTLIDFSTYSDDSLALFDLAYLEFWLLLTALPPDTPNRRKDWLYLCPALFQRVTLEDVPGSKDVSSAEELIADLRETVNHHMEDSQQPDHFLRSYQVAALSAGLNWFVNLTTPYEQNAALLYASHALYALLRRLEIDVFAKGKGQAEVPWMISVLTIPEESQDLLRSRLSPTLRQKDNILVLGPEVARSLKLPTDSQIVNDVSGELQRSLDFAGRDDDPAWFDALCRGASQPETEEIKLAVSRQVSMAEESMRQGNKLKNLARVNWAAVLDWSMHEGLMEIVQQSTETKRRVNRVLPRKEDVTIAYMGSSLCFPWIFLRGSATDSRTLVLGNSQWRLSKERRQILTRLSSSAVGQTAVLFVGIRGSLLKSLYDELQQAFNGQLEAWVAAEYINRDQEALTLEQTEGVNLVSVSWEELLHFLGDEFEAAPELEPVADQYVIDIKEAEIPGEEPTSVEAAVRPITIPVDTFQALSEYLEIPYRNIVSDTSSPDHPPGLFYKGHRIGWKELALAYDAERKETDYVLTKTLLPDLDVHTPRRVQLRGEPGAGSTTIAARLAWDVYSKKHIPVALITKQDSGLFDAISRFYDIFNKSFLLVADEAMITFDYSDRLFEQLEDRLIPVVLLQVGQTQHAQQEWPPDTSKVHRHFEINDHLNERELRDLRTRLDRVLTDEQRGSLDQCPDDSLFLNLLTAFEEQYVRVEKLVKDLLSFQPRRARELVSLVAFSSRYGHIAIPKAMLARVSGLSPETVESLLEPFKERLILDQWIPDSTGVSSYICRHPIIAEKILQVLWGGEIDE